VVLWLERGGGGATRPLPRDRGVEELYRDPTVGTRPKVWTRGKNGSSAKDGAPERLGCGTIQEEVHQILQKVSTGAVHEEFSFRLILHKKEENRRL